ncbi:helix-turn-helix domain-containing protein, partial [Streptomyces capparidis]
MARWKPLPEDLEPDVRRLAVRLRELKDRTDLSLAALAARTAVSKSSWERYLNGKALPPRQAVRALGRLAGESGPMLEAMWELADRAYSGRAATAEEGPPTAAGGDAFPPVPRNDTPGAPPPDPDPSGAAPRPRFRRTRPGDAATLCAAV